MGGTDNNKRTRKRKLDRGSEDWKKEKKNVSGGIAECTGCKG